jgi:nucleotide-binding universal stress UspA family protein
MRTRPVIVGTDGTENSKAAVIWAAREAQRRGLPLRIAHVFEWDWEEYRYSIGNDYIDVSRQMAEAVVNNATRQAQQVDPRLAIETDTLIGHTAARLLDIADQAELMVLGHRGRGGFAGLRLGSVSQRVATHAPCPVLVVRGREDPDGPVVAGLDDSPAADQVLETAFDAATAHRSALSIVRSYLPPIPLWLENVRASEVETPEQDAAELARVEEQLAPWRAKYPDVAVEILVTHEGAASSLVGASLCAQLVVVGSRGRGRIRGALLGSAGLQLLHHAECPVLIARPHEAATAGKHPESGA